MKALWTFGNNEKLYNLVKAENPSLENSKFKVKDKVNPSLENCG